MALTSTQISEASAILNDPNRTTKQQTPDIFYIERNDDQSVKSFLFCSPSGKDKIPSCTHKFRNNGLLYQIHWNISELPNWQSQMEGAINFIDSLEFKPEAAQH